MHPNKQKKDKTKKLAGNEGLKLSQVQCGSETLQSLLVCLGYLLEYG